MESSIPPTHSERGPHIGISPLLNGHLIVIEILKNVKLSRREREGKPRIDYIGLAIEIVNDLLESN